MHLVTEQLAQVTTGQADTASDITQREHEMQFEMQVKLDAETRRIIEAYERRLRMTDITNAALVADFDSKIAGLRSYIEALNHQLAGYT